MKCGKDEEEEGREERKRKRERKSWEIFWDWGPERDWLELQSVGGGQANLKIARAAGIGHTHRFGALR